MIFKVPSNLSHFMILWWEYSCLVKIQVTCPPPCWLLTSSCKRFGLSLQNLLCCIHVRYMLRKNSCYLKSRSLTGLKFTTERKNNKPARKKRPQKTHIVSIFCFFPQTSNMYRIVSMLKWKTKYFLHVLYCFSLIDLFGVQTN